MSDPYDVIVIGAGPGGGTAAYFLGERGYRVLVLEKSRLPRYKAYGRGLPARVLDQFPFSFHSLIEARAASVSTPWVTTWSRCLCRSARSTW